MRKENNRVKNNLDDRKKWINVLGFVFSVVLLSIAIFLSINQAEIDKLASIDEYTISNLTLATSSEMGKGVNEVVIEEDNSSNRLIINEVENETKEINTSNKSEEIKENNVETEEKNNDEIKENNEKNTTADSEEEKKQFIKPLDGEVYKEFSMNSLVYSDTLQEWITHRGIDIQANESDDVKASSDGTIKAIKNDPRYGWSITIEHKDGFETIYTCLANIDMVKEGEEIKQGQVIAKAGNSGVFESADGIHLHFEMTKNGEFINPEMYIK